MNIRIGQGYDVHQLVEGRPLILGGVTVPFGKGLLGHSDADALLHALTDALLGAAGLGDIGSHFPDTAAEFKDADSRVLLREAYKKRPICGLARGQRRYHHYRAAAETRPAHSRHARQYRRRFGPARTGGQH